MSDDEDNFSVVELAPDVYMCRERHYGRKWNVANLYVVRGTELDLIIDTGLGLWDYKQFLVDKKLIEAAQEDKGQKEECCTGTRGTSSKPYQAVVTHVHFDHAGGLYQFANQSVIHVEELEALENGNNIEACTFLTQSDCAKNPPTPDWRARDYTLQAVQPTRVLRAGADERFELGNNRSIRVIHTPGHSRGSICLWDETNGYLFSGDTLYEGEVLDWAPTSNVEDYLHTMELLSDLAPQVKRVFPGHGDEIDGKYIAKVANEYVANAGYCHSCTTRIAQSLAIILGRGRNAKTGAKCERCCYHACCCCLLLGPAVKQS